MRPQFLKPARQSPRGGLHQQKRPVARQGHQIEPLELRRPQNRVGIAIRQRRVANHKQQHVLHPGGRLRQIKGEIRGPKRPRFGDHHQISGGTPGVDEKVDNQFLHGGVIIRRAHGARPGQPASRHSARERAGDRNREGVADIVQIVDASIQPPQQRRQGHAEQGRRQQSRNDHQNRAQRTGAVGRLRQGINADGRRQQTRLAVAFLLTAGERQRGGLFVQFVV